jgi:hypothetical protein
MNDGLAGWRKSTYSAANGNCVEVATSPWRKSSHSAYNGDCAEVAAWRKSSRSANNGACVEAGYGDAVVGVRDTKLKDSPVLVFPAAAWAAFTAAIRGAP